jgi:pyridoxine 5'-phosphate synthase PdxJ
VLDQLRADGRTIREEDVRRLSPLASEHINLVGRYHLIPAETVEQGAYRPLKTASPAGAVSA